MTYQVLARKWRPKTFHELVGQQHVLQALVNAMESQRLHHAYLFSGTRGVGKTTIARILARCLNCEQGITANPCGQCSPCREIVEGRFVDLIEVDAASRTKVEDTRELLENVQYKPTRGRFKVYLIDEVHMLSTSSFNALLKTLEEPPEHVKFLLATTDPQKLPVTVLSRCLQFHLKNMEPERIVAHLRNILSQEQVPFDDRALWQIAKAADGSMRDALSLTDQAIAYGGGALHEAEVANMLGTIEHSFVLTLLQALARSDAKALFQCVEALAQQTPDYGAVLAELLAQLHRLAMAQVVPEVLDDQHPEDAELQALATQLPAEDIQLFYQTALLGRRDLPLSPDPRSGLEMVLLRMLAFRPVGVHSVPTTALPVENDSASVASVSEVPVKKSETAVVESSVLPDSLTAVAGLVRGRDLAQKPVEKSQRKPSHDISVAESPTGEVALTPDAWSAWYRANPLSGVLHSVAGHCELIAMHDNQLHFVLDEEQSALYDDVHQQRLASVLSDKLGEDVRVRIDVGPVRRETPIACLDRMRQERVERVATSLQQEPLMQALQHHFGATINLEQVVPYDKEDSVKVNHGTKA